MLNALCNNFSKTRSMWLIFYWWNSLWQSCPLCFLWMYRVTSWRNKIKKDNIVIQSILILWKELCWDACLCKCTNLSTDYGMVLIYFLLCSLLHWSSIFGSKCLFLFVVLNVFFYLFREILSNLPQVLHSEINCLLACKIRCLLTCAWGTELTPKDCSNRRFLKHFLKPLNQAYHIFSSIQLLTRCTCSMGCQMTCSFNW